MWGPDMTGKYVWGELKNEEMTEARRGSSAIQAVFGQLGGFVSTSVTFRSTKKFQIRLSTPRKRAIR
jgi:hypothetical protein